MSNEQTPRNKGGRPATGQTPVRNVRIGSTWTRAEELALKLARLAGTVRTLTNRSTQQEQERGDITAYVEEALRRENDRQERLLKRRASEGSSNMPDEPPNI